MIIYSLVDENGLRTMKDIDRFIRGKECITLTTLANSTRWKMGQAGKFPRHIRIGRRAAGHRFLRVQAWIRGE